MTRKKKTKEQIKQEIKTELLDELVIKELILSHKEKLANVDQLAKEESQGFKKMFNSIFRNDAEQLAEFKTRDYYKAVTDKGYWANYYTKEIQACDILLGGLNQIEELKSVKRYADTIDFITSDTAPLFYVQSEELEKAQATADGIIESYNFVEDVFRLYDELLNDFLVEYLSTAEQLRPSVAEEIIFNISRVLLFGDLSKDDDLKEQGTAQAKEQRYLSELSDQLKPYWYAIKDIRNNAFIILYKTPSTELEQNIEEENAKKIKPMLFSRYATFTQDALTNELGLIKYYDESNLPTIDFDLREETITEGNETLNKLSELDIMVLRTIVIEFFYKQKKRDFTDKEVVLFLTQENARKPVKGISREKVNKSILKLQNIRIDLKFKSLQEINNEILNAKRGNPLVWINERLEIEGDNGVKYYTILGTPFYYTYLNVTQTPLIEFDRKLLTNDYDGIDKSLDNQQLRYYLITRLEPKSRLNSKSIFISATDIYQAQEITAKKYDTPASLRKAKERARQRAELVLNEFRKVYKFSFNADNETGKIDKKTGKKEKYKGKKFGGFNITFHKI